VANNDSYTIAEDTPTNLAVLANDTDPDGDPLTPVVATGPANGSVTPNADGTLRYTPNANFNGVDVFTYKAFDGALYSAPATVQITVNAVNDAPVAVADAYSINENQTLTVGPAPQPVTSLTMTSQPGDYVGQGQSYSYATANAIFSAYHTFGYGIAVFVQSANSSDDWELDFAAPYHAAVLAGNYPGATRFPFEAINVPGLDVSGEGRGSNTLTGQFTVLQANYAPDGTVQRFDATFVQHSEGATPALTGEVKYNAAAAGPGVLANDTDVDANLLTAAVVSGPAHGTLTLNANGTFSYTPNANFYGTDSFTYAASDGALTSNVATVTITVNHVNQPPVAAG
jgi:VCBS repeat-containing protein